jgi:adenylosuccinate synthase
MDPDLQVEVEEHPGWSEDLRGVRQLASLPSRARAFLERLAKVTGVPIPAVSVGPERSALAT